MKLILEGGGARAAYSAGVVDALANSGAHVEAVVGCSSGSINAAFFASKQTRTLCELWGDYVPGKHFISWRRQLTPFAGPGLAVDDMLDRVMIGQGLFDPIAATSGTPELYVAVTDVDTCAGQLVRPSQDNVMQWLRASLALPVGYNRVVSIEGRGYIDGGVALPVPFATPLERPVTGPTVVVLTRKMQTEKAAPTWWERLLIHALVPRAALAPTLKQHHLHNSLMRELRQARERGDVVVIDPPDEMPLRRFSRDAPSIRAAIELGREVGARIPERVRASQAAGSLEPAPRAGLEEETALHGCGGLPAGALPRPG